MKRDHHLQNSQREALKLIGKGYAIAAWFPFCADLSRHDETAGHEKLAEGDALVKAGQLRTPEDMAQFISSFA